MKNKLKNILLGFVLVMVIYSCQKAAGDSPGSEYMPDMAHSIAVEANTYNYYGLNTWDEQSTLTLRDLAGAKEPVKGTVPRGYAGVSLAANATTKEEVMDILTGQDGKSIAVPVNGKVPYYYADTEDERTRASAEITFNPFPITADGLARGKELYNIFCAVCHGTKGNFNDGIYETGIYPAAPANLINDEFTAASPGRYYHAIMYGKNVMGAYKDKINYEERWQVIHYIRSLQAKEQEKAYNEQENTLNEYAVPGANLAMNAVDEVMEKVEEETGTEVYGEATTDEGESHSDNAHSGGVGQ